LSLGAETTPSVILSDAQRTAIAAAFAPTLLLHPLEKYAPTSPMGASDDVPEGWRARVAGYEALTQDAKLQQAAIGYRVFSRTRHGIAEVVVEYWCYYVYNAFTVRGGWLPYRVSDNHPHDLERLFIVLTPRLGGIARDDPPDVSWARRSFRLHTIIANAHDGSVPPNQYDARGTEEPALPISILVERGSHAMAPDINEDGLFTPGVDADISKLLWGIRDRGATWGHYHADYMERREKSAVRLCGPGDDSIDDEACSRYVLYPADSVRPWFEGLKLTRGEQRDILGRTPWLFRAFGDIKVERLMVPNDAPDGHVLDRMRRRGPTSEAGFIVGFTTVRHHEPALVAGRRAVWHVSSPRLPDIAAEAVAMLPTTGSPVAEATLSGSYSLDAITNVLLGVGWSSETKRLDAVLGSDVRLGRFRVQPMVWLLSGSFAARITTKF
jgi:hypothetical protein